MRKLSTATVERVHIDTEWPKDYGDDLRPCVAGKRHQFDVAKYFHANQRYVGRIKGRATYETVPARTERSPNQFWSVSRERTHICVHCGTVAHVTRKSFTIPASSLRPTKDDKAYYAARPLTFDACAWHKAQGKKVRDIDPDTLALFNIVLPEVAPCERT